MVLNSREYRFGKILLAASAQGRDDVVLLLFADESLLFLRGVRYHQPPGGAPNQAERAFYVENGLPAEVRGQHAGQQNGNHGAERGS